MSEQELELPKGWVKTKLDDICIKINDGTHHSPENTSQGDFPYITAKNIRPGKIDLSNITYVSKESHKEIFARCNPVKGDVLYTKDGTVGYAVVNNLDFDFSLLSSVALLKPNHEIINSYYLEAFLNNPVNYNNVTKKMTGSALRRIILETIKKIEIPISPLNEQKRIVSKIEELLSKIDSTKQSLEQTKLQLEQYRYSYHNWIFHGDFKEKFGFSSNWEEKSLGKTFKIIGGGTPDTKKSQYWDGDIPWITSADIHGIKNIVPRRRVSQLGIDNSATNKIPPNSILVVTRVGLGKLAITDEPICINQDVQAVIIDSNLALPLFVLNYLSQTIQIFRFRNQGTTISGVTKKQLSDIPFFLPSLDEQEKIIEYVEMAEARIQNSQNIVNSTLQTLQTMKMSVLKNAFEGKLVPQDPNDEPAEKLLERIKKEKS